MEPTAEPARSLLWAVLDAAIALTGAQMGNVQLLDRGKLKIVAQRGFRAPFLKFFADVEHGQAACGEAMQRRAQVVVEDVTSHPIFMGTRALEEVLAAGVRAVQSTPIVDSKEALLGMLSTHFRQPHRPDRRDLRLLDLLARGAAASIERDATSKDLLLKERQLEKITNDLMDLARLNLGRLELRKTCIDVADGVREAVEGLRSLMESMGHELSFESFERSIQMPADMARLTQVIGNLVFTAAKSMAKGGHIMVSLERVGDQAVIRVRNQGIGFDAGESDRLFQIFTQQESSGYRFSSGLGVGLALAKSIVELHGGTIEGHIDDRGRASEFIARLPIAPSAVPEAVTAVAQGRLVIKHRILIVDGHQDSASYVASGADRRRP